MNIYENKDKNAIRLLAVLVLGIFLVSVMPTPPANETETPLTTRTPTITNDALEFFNSYVEEVQNTEPKTAWQRLDSALQTYVDTGTPTPEMYLIKGHPHVLIVAVPGFDVASLPAGLDIGRVAPLPFMTVIEATVTEPDLLLQTAAVEGVAEIDADVYLLGTRPVAPTLEAKPEPVNLADRAMDWARELLQEDGRIAPTRQDVRELTGVETITTAGYDGSGVLVAIDDSGVDFGLPNLAPAIDIDTAGYPTSYDDGGEGLLYAPIPAHETPSGVIPADESWDDYPLQRNFDGSPDQAFSIWEYWYYLGTPINSGPDGAWQSATVPTGVSKSGVWKFGWARHGPAGNYRWVASAFCDPYTAGVYERMYIDWETSWAVTMEYYGLTSWESTSTINWNLLDEHAAGDYWDMRLTPQQALGIDPDGAGPLTGEGPSAWAVSHDYWNGTFFGFGTYGQHVDTTLEYAHTQTAANNFTSIIMEYCWLDNPYYPITNAVNRFNVTMDTATAAGTITGSYVLNGLFDAGDIIHHRFYGLNVSGDMVAIGGSEWQNWTVNAVDNTDGYVDMSLGALAHTYDLADLAPSYDYIAFMTGDPDETYGALMWDMLNHGTWCAIDVAARGHVDDPSIPLYDVFLNGSATYDIRGQAPGASVLATKTYTSGNYFWNFMWINALSGRGSDYEAWSGSYVNLNPWADQYSGMWLGYDDAFVGGIYMEFSDYYNHQANYNPADIVSLSWGYLSWAPYAWVDMLFEGTSLAGTDSPFGATWPGVLYTTGAGNRGPGYGSATGPGSPLMLHVGAATSFHTLDNFYGPNQWSNELVGFQDRGPSTYGGHSADILTYGQSETTLTKVHDVWSGYLGVASWSGTSMSNPIAAGSIAALKDAARTIRSYEPTPVELKNLVMSTAQDMGADAYTQGCGLLDLGEAYNFIVGGSSEELMYTDASQYAARLADAVHDFWLENMGISYIRHDAGMEASYFTGVMMPGESQNFSIFRTDDTGGAAISAGGVVTGAPSDGNTHILNQTSIKTAMFSNNATWDSGSLTSRYNTTTGAQTAWNLTELLWGNAAALTTWASYEDGWVAFQINTDANAATYFFLHAWEDLDSDGLLEYMNATYTDPTAEDWWNSYVVYYDGEAHRIQLSNQNYPQTTMWVRASTLAALEAGGYTLALVEGTGFHPDADAGSFTDLNYTIWAEFYAVEDWSWVTTDTTANTDNSYNVTIDVPASAEPGFYEGFVQYEAGGATFPITINVGATLTEYNATETAGGPAPIITNEYLPGMGYDSAEYRQGDAAAVGNWFGPDARRIWVEVDDMDATGIIITANWSTPGTDMNIEVFTAGGTSLGDLDSVTTATGMTTKTAISGMGWYIVQVECWASDPDTSRLEIDLAINWVEALPVITPLLDGMAWPANGDSIGLVSDYGHANTTLVWDLTTATKATYPTLSIVGSTLGTGIPPLEETVDWEMAGSEGSIYCPENAGLDPWFFYAGTQVHVELHWVVGLGSDMMDAVFEDVNHNAVTTGSDTSMGSGDPSPEVGDYIIPATGEYHLRIDNFAGEDNYGHVYVYGLIPADEPSSSTTDTVSFNLAGMNEVPQWSFAATALDSWGYAYSVTSTVNVRNISPPSVEITSTIPDTVSGTLSLTISVVDLQNTNALKTDDQPVWVHLYYTADEREAYLIPIQTYINATDASASDTVDITYSWDTTRAFNAYIARLWVVADDFVGRSSWASETFAISNTAGEAAGMPASSESNSNLFGLGLLLVVVLGIGALPILRKLMRTRRP